MPGSRNAAPAGGLHRPASCRSPGITVDQLNDAVLGLQSIGHDPVWTRGPNQGLYRSGRGALQIGRTARTGARTDPAAALCYRTNPLPAFGRGTFIGDRARPAPAAGFRGRAARWIRSGQDSAPQ